MTDHQRDRIARLLAKYPAGSTDQFLGYIADIDGMLTACRKLLQEYRDNGPATDSWLRRECFRQGVDPRTFLRELEQVVPLFEPGEDDDHYTTLGITPEADPAEIKQAYRKLSLQYHPDTASAEYRNDPDRFIRITRAYHQLCGDEAENGLLEQGNSRSHWRKEKKRGTSDGQRKRVYMWIGGLLLVLLILSVFLALNYRQRTMLAALQQSRGAFIPPTEVISPAILDSSDRSFYPEEPERTQTTANEQVASGVQHQADAPILEEREVIAVETKTGDAAIDTAIIEPEPKQIEMGNQQKVDSSDDLTETPEESSITDSRADGAEPSEPSNETKNLQPLEQQTQENISEERSGEVVEKPEIPGPAVDTTMVAANEHVPLNEGVETPNSDIGTSDDTELVNRAAVSETEEEYPVEEQRVAASEPSTGLSKLATPDPFQQEDDPSSKYAALVVQSIVEPLSDENQLAPPARDMDKPAEVAEDTDPTPEPDIQSRVNTFIEQYTAAYEQGNLVQFLQFFMPDAVENGKNFSNRLSVYREMFEVTEKISLKITISRVEALSDEIQAEGMFRVSLDYMSGKHLEGTGPIDFVLQNSDNNLLIKEFSYDFDD